MANDDPRTCAFAVTLVDALAALEKLRLALKVRKPTGCPERLCFDATGKCVEDAEQALWVHYLSLLPDDKPNRRSCDPPPRVD